jgi:hypothetical protein
MKPQQSKLDEILARLHELHFSTGEDDDYKPMTREEAKEAIKSLSLEIVNSSSSSWDAITNLRELKARIEEL